MMKNYYPSALFFVMVGTLLVGCAAQQLQPPPSLFEPVQLKAEQYEPKVDNFMVILDASSSMNEKYNGQSKFKIAKDFLDAMNKTIPEVGFNGALRTFGHDAGVSKKLTELFYGPTDYSTSGFEEGLTAISRAGGTSPMVNAINAAGDDLSSAQGKTAVIIVSDGEDMGQQPVMAAESLKSQLGDGLCIFTVLIGDSPAGKQALEQIAEAGGCGTSTTADEIASSGGMAGFVEGIFLAKAAPKPAPAPAPKPMDSDGDGVPDNLDQCPNTPMGATVDARGCWTYDAKVLFDVNSAEIKPEAYPMLDEASSILRENPALNVEIDGHTDNTGPADYNMKLSESRATNVMEYFIRNGIDPNRLTIKGFGSTKPAASNDTREGRAKNRRVELTPVE
ncbi:MAG: OmpA family protein [Desulfobacterales bacterium]|jgi:OOP family OmpA-OmpF porin